MSYVLGESCITCKASWCGLIMICLCICELVKVSLWGFHCVHRTVEGTREAMKYERYHLTLLICKMKTVLCCAKLLWSCQILCESMDCNPPGSSVHGILQARILEWIAMPSSRGSSWPRDGTWVPYVSSIGRQILYH